MINATKAKREVSKRARSAGLKRKIEERKEENRRNKEEN